MATVLPISVTPAPGGSGLIEVSGNAGQFAPSKSGSGIAGINILHDRLMAQDPARWASTRLESGPEGFFKITAPAEQQSALMTALGNLVEDPVVGYGHQPGYGAWTNAQGALQKGLGLMTPTGFRFLPGQVPGADQGGWTAPTYDVPYGTNEMQQGLRYWYGVGANMDPDFRSKIPTLYTFPGGMVPGGTGIGPGGAATGTPSIGGPGIGTTGVAPTVTAPVGRPGTFPTGTSTGTASIGGPGVGTSGVAPTEPALVGRPGNFATTGGRVPATTTPTSGALTLAIQDPAFHQALLAALADPAQAAQWVAAWQAAGIPIPNLSDVQAVASGARPISAADLAFFKAPLASRGLLGGLPTPAPSPAPVAGTINTEQAHLNLRTALEGSLNDPGKIAFIAQTWQAAGLRVPTLDEVRAWLAGTVTVPDAELRRYYQALARVGAIPPLPSYQSGTAFVPQTGPAVVHRGEMILPRPVAAQVRARATPRPMPRPILQPTVTRPDPGAW